MKRFLICAGLHCKEEALRWLLRTVNTRRPDGILFAGGVLSPSRQYAPWDGTQLGITHGDLRFMESFFETLGKTGCFTAVIPGPFDTPLDEFLRLGFGAEIDFPNVHVAHATLVTEKDVAICGMGGCLVEEPVLERDVVPRSTVEFHLRTLWTARQPRTILLLPDAPKDRLGGTEGSSLSSALIDSYHPTLCVVGGSSARRGFEQVASTLVINPGSLEDGCAAWLDWGRNKMEDQVELLHLNVEMPTEGAGVVCGDCSTSKGDPSVRHREKQVLG